MTEFEKAHGPMSIENMRDLSAAGWRFADGIAINGETKYRPARDGRGGYEKKSVATPGPVFVAVNGCAAYHATCVWWEGVDPAPWPEAF